MTTFYRPTQIATILQTVSSGDDTTASTELETYIAELEAKQPNRPARIVAILQTLSTQHPTDMVMVLDAYITNLEANQQTVAPKTEQVSAYDVNNPPAWSHQRDMERTHRRHERALRKLNDYL